MKEDLQNGMKHVSVNVDQMQLFVIINNVEIKINVDVNAKNQLIKECVVKNLFGILVIVSECDKACNLGEYLDYENCKCRRKLVAPLIEECTETVEEVKLAKITLAENENSYKCSSCTVYIVLMIVFFTIFTGITTSFIYYNWSLIKNNVSCVKFYTHKETKIW